MGRKRIDEKEKKVGRTITLKQKYYDELDKRTDNLSKLFEDLVKKYLKM